MSTQPSDPVGRLAPAAERRVRRLESLVSHLAVVAVVAASVAAVAMRSPAPTRPVAAAPAGTHAASHQG